MTEPTTTRTDAARRRSHPVRQFNKYLLNPLMLRLAGTRYWYASVVHHVGRRSGRRYATPVVAIPVDDGFVIPLPYGPDTDWLRNVLHAGSATLTYGGRTREVTAPAVLGADEVRPQLPRPRARVLDAVGVTAYLTVRTRPHDEDLPPS